MGGAVDAFKSAGGLKSVPTALGFNPNLKETLKFKKKEYASVMKAKVRTPEELEENRNANKRPGLTMTDDPEGAEEARRRRAARRPAGTVVTGQGSTLGDD